MTEWAYAWSTNKIVYGGIVVLQVLPKIALLFLIGLVFLTYYLVDDSIVVD